MSLKNILSVILFVFTINAANRDSLIQRLHSESNLTYEQQLDLFYEIGISYNDEQLYEEALFYFTDGLSKSDDNLNKARFFYRIGETFVDSTNYQLALENLSKSLELFLIEDDISVLFNVHTLIGMCYGLTSDLEKAIVSFNSALQVSKKLKDSTNIAQGYFNIGLANYFLGKYDAATDYYIQSLKIREELTDTNSLVKSLTTVGEILRTRGKYAEAMNYYMQALSLKKSINDKEALAYVYSEIGLIYKNEKKYKQALAYMDTSLQISREGKYKRGIATLYTYMGGIEKELGNTNKALDLYLKSIDAYHDIDFQNGIAQSQIAIARIYYEKGNYTKATALLKSAQQKAKSNNLLEEQTNIAELLYKIGKATGSKTTLARLEEYIVLKDSLFNIEKEKQINEIETKYETEKKEEQINLLDQETKLQQQQLSTQKYLLWGTVLFTLMIIVVAILFIRQNRLRTQLKVEQGKQRLLRSQMNPHFIYNALAAIQSFVIKNNPMESASYISGFTRLMRIVLESSREDFIPLSEEKEFLEIYLKLQQLRFNNKFTFSIVIDDNINEEEIMIPPMLIQPIVENAIEHGIRNLENNNGRIELKYKLIENNLTIDIIDNGPGLSLKKQSVNKEHKSLAREILSERLNNLVKMHNLIIDVDYNEAYQDEKNKGTKVTFTIPVRTT
nr:tetratricopeptide repeat protein [uncultured Sphaerochaeta sp.]